MSDVSSSPAVATSRELRAWISRTITEATRGRRTTIGAINQALRETVGPIDLRSARGWKTDRPFRRVPRAAIAVIAELCQGELRTGLRLWDEADSPATTVSALASPRHALQGRGDEMDQCRHLLADARDQGEAVLAIAVGEQGIGKTELTRHLAVEAAAAGFEILATSARPGIAALEEAVGIPVRRPEDVRLLVGDAGAGLEADRIGALCEALLDRASVRPLLLVAEDLHDSYPSELSALRDVTMRVRAPMVVFCTTRPLAPANRNADAYLALAERAHIVKLGLLDAPAMAAMVDEAAAALAPAERARLTRALFTLTRGHPFRLDLLLRMHLLDGTWCEGMGLEDLDEAGQLTIVQLERRKVAQLPPETRAALQAAALVGMEFDLTLLRQLPLLAAEAARLGSHLQPAVDLGLITPGHRLTSHVFTHEFVREAVISATPALVQVDLHRQIADHLRSGAARGWSSDRLEHALTTLNHLCEARRGDDELGTTVVAWSLWANQLAIEAFDPRMAADAIRKGFDALPDNEAELPMARAILHDVAETGPVHTGRRKSLEGAFALLQSRESAENLDLLVAVVGQLAFQAIFGHLEPILLEALTRTLASVPADRLSLRAQLEASLAWYLAWTGAPLGPDGTSLRTLSELALSHALGSDDAGAIYQARLAQSIALLTSPDVEAAFTNAQSMRDPLGLFAADILIVYLRLGDRQHFREGLETFRDISNARNRLWHRGMCAQFDACDAFLSGRFDDAAQHVADLLVSAEETKDNNFALLHLAGGLWLEYEAGSVERARRECHRLLESGPALPGLKAALMLFEAGPGGDLARARALLGELLGNGLDHIPRDISWTMILAFLAETAARLDDDAAARIIYGELLQYRRQMIVLATGIVVIGAVDRFLGLLTPLLGGGDTSDAIAYFDAAADLEYKMGSPPLLARTRYWHGCTLNRAGRQAEAALVLEQGLEDTPEDMRTLRRWMAKELRDARRR